MNALVGKGGVSSGHFQRRCHVRTDGHGRGGFYIATDAGGMGQGDHLFVAYGFRNFNGGYVE